MYNGFRWTQATGKVSLGYMILPTAVTDANTIVGAQVGSSTTTAWVLNSQVGSGDLKTLLQNCGINLTGWTLVIMRGVSPDGRAMVGTGINPSGKNEAILVRLR